MKVRTGDNKVEPVAAVKSRFQNRNMIEDIVWVFFLKRSVIRRMIIRGYQPRRRIGSFIKERSRREARRLSQIKIT
jgi:hypothetical protein